MSILLDQVKICLNWFKLVRNNLKLAWAHLLSCFIFACLLCFCKTQETVLRTKMQERLQTGGQFMACFSVRFMVTRFSARLDLCKCMVVSSDHLATKLEVNKVITFK